MEFELVELPNGIRCILKRVASPVVYCGMTIGAGTRDEEKEEHGMAHLIEHLLFKGTQRRKPYHINSLLDNVGGELNAYTTKEETVVHATVLRQDLAKAVDLISDVVFHSIFSPVELNRERGVVIDEINSYKDSPSELIFDDFEDMIFAGCSLGRNILGTPRYLKKFSSEDLKAFIRRNYRTDKMVFALVGNVSLHRFTDICYRYFSDIPASLSITSRMKVPAYTCQNRVISKKGYQVNCIIGGRAYSHYDKKRIPLALLSNILGGSSANSRLNISLREKNGLSYSVESSYTSYQDTGVVTVYFGCERDNLERCLSLVYKELSLLREQPLSTLQLARAKKQLIGQLAISSESGESVMLGGAKSFLVYNRSDSQEEIADKINQITSSELIDTAREIYEESRLSVLIYQ